MFKFLNCCWKASRPSSFSLSLFTFNGSLSSSLSPFIVFHKWAKCSISLHIFDHSLSLCILQSLWSLLILRVGGALLDKPALSCFCLKWFMEKVAVNLKRNSIFYSFYKHLICCERKKYLQFFLFFLPTFSLLMSINFITPIGCSRVFAYLFKLIFQWTNRWNENVYFATFETNFC